MLDGTPLYVDVQAMVRRRRRVRDGSTLCIRVVLGTGLLQVLREDALRCREV